MKRWMLAGACALALSVPHATLAAVSRTFVSTKGSDANPCSLTLPCRSVDAAFAQTSNRGEIVVLDSGGYGYLTANTGVGVSVVAPPGVYAAISGATVVINDGNAMTLRGLTITSMVQLWFGTLTIDRCVIDVPPIVTAGLYMDGYTKAIVKDTVISGAGIGIMAEYTSDVELTVSDTTFKDVGYGISLHAGSGPVKATITRSRLIGPNSGSGTGIGIESAGGPALAHVTDTVITQFGAGVSANGPGAVATVSGSELTFNGFALTPSNNAVIALFAGNQFTGNNYLLHSSGGNLISGGGNFKFHNNNESLGVMAPLTPF